MALSRRALLAAPAVLAAGRARGDEPVVLRVGNQKGGLRSLLEASGLAGGTPYRLEWAEFSAAAPLLEALNAGALDVGYQGDLAFLTSYAAGNPVRAIGAGRPSPAGQAILVRTDGPITTPADLRGKRIAGNRGGWGQFLVRAALARAGIAPTDADLVLLPPTEAALAFRSSAVDAWAIWEPYVSLEVLQFGARVLTDGRGLTPSIVFVSAHVDAIRDKRAALADFLRRFADGWRWAASHRPEYAATNAALTHIPQPALLRAYETEATQAVPITDALVAEFQDAADRAVEFGLLGQRVDIRPSLTEDLA